MGEIVRTLQYIVIIHSENKPLTKTFIVKSKHYSNKLGTIQWYGPWRQYILDTEPKCQFSAGCLEDLGTFLKELNDEHRRHLDESHQTS